MAAFITSLDQNQTATATLDAATGWVTVTIAEVHGPGPGLISSALVQVLNGGRTIRLAPALATAVGDAAAGR